MTELHELLDRRAGSIEPGPQALEALFRRARRRERRRHMAASSGAVVVAVAVLAGILDGGNGARLPGAGNILLADQAALAVRQGLGIFGSTKEAGNTVVVKKTTPQGQVRISLVPIDTAEAHAVSISEAKDATVSPKGDVAAAVTKDDGLVVVDSRSGSKSELARPGPKPSPPSVSWDRNGSALFALVSGRWLEVRNPGRPGSLTRELRVPTLPGGPTLLSISPSRDRALLFGVVRGAAGREPRLYLGTFDGTAIRDVRPVAAPSGALGGPMGWVGENAFLLRPAPGQALIVRTDGTRVPVYARGIPDPCSSAAPGDSCVYRGPRLLGTNGDGSLLFWRVAALRGGERAIATFVIRYYRTWLDGRHAVRLTGPAGRYGPPVAPR